MTGAASQNANARTYALTREAVEAQELRSIRMSLRMKAVVFAGVLLTAVWRGDAIYWPAVAAFAVYFGIKGVREVKAIRKHRPISESLRIRLDGDAITRTQQSVPEIRVHRSEASRIRESPSGLLVISRPRHLQLLVPRGIDGYFSVRAALAGWRPIEQQSAWSKTLTLLIATTVSLGMGAGLFLSHSPRVVMPIGAIYLGLYVYVIIELRRNPHAWAQLKRLPPVWFAAAAFPVMVLYRIWQVMSGP